MGEEKYGRDFVIEKKVHGLINRALHETGLRVAPKYFPKVVLIPNSKTPGYDFENNIIYLNNTSTTNGDDIGEEAIGHLIRDNVSLDLKTRIYRTPLFAPLKKFVKSDGKAHYTGEFFGYLGRRVLRSIARPEDNLFGDDYVRSNKKSVLRLKENRKRRNFLKNKTYSSKEEKNAASEELVGLFNERAKDLVHDRPYRFASQLDLSKVNLKEVYQLSDSEVRRRFFRDDPIYDARKLEQKLGVAIALIGLSGSILFSSRITGNVVGSNLNSSSVGVGLFLVGLVGAFFYFRKK